MSLFSRWYTAQSPPFTGSVSIIPRVASTLTIVEDYSESIKKSDILSLGFHVVLEKQQISICRMTWGEKVPDLSEKDWRALPFLGVQCLVIAM